MRKNRFTWMFFIWIGILLPFMTFAQEDSPDVPILESNESKENCDQAFLCQRHFQWKGKKRPLDSYHQQDAENLRPILDRSPKALKQLQMYQEKQTSIDAAAYLGTIGLAIALGGHFLGKRFKGKQKSQIQTISMISGLSITAGSLIYSFGSMHSSKSHLKKAVEIYNENHPKTPIELKLEAGVRF